MKLLSLCVILPALPLAAQGVAEIAVRVVTIEKPGTATALEAAAPECDEKLFASLTASVAAGEAKTIQDQIVNVRGGMRSKVEGVREYPVLQHARADPLNWFLYPDDFHFRMTGSGLEVEATVSETDVEFSNRLIDINAAPFSVEFLTLNPWPVPDLRGAGRMGRTLHPVLAEEQFTVQLMTCTGITTLVSVASSPRNALSPAAQPSFRYSFIRAGLNGEKPANRAALRGRIIVPGQHRLHAVTIRLPRDEAAALMMQNKADDAALFAALTGRVAGGRATLSAHSAVLCRRGQRSQMQSQVKFPVPGRSVDLIPEEWKYETAGQSFVVESEGGEEMETCFAWNHGLEMREGLEMIEYHPDASRPDLHGAVAEQVVRLFNGPGNIPPSGILCSGILSTSPATEDENTPAGTTDICFLLQSPPPGKTEEKPKPQIFLQALILSVVANEGQDLASANKSPDSARASSLISRLSSGTIHCAGHAGLVIRSGQLMKTSCIRTVMQPEKFLASKAMPALSVPGSWESSECGMVLEGARFVSVKDKMIISGTLKWDAAPVLPFGEPGAGIPKLEARRCMEEIPLSDFRIPEGIPAIVDVRPSKAREGTPEHGRWHVLILKAMQSGKSE